MPRIHPSAVVDSKAELAADVSVGPYAIVGPGVRLAARVQVYPHAHIRGRTAVGAGTRIFPFAVIGEEPQDKSFDPNREARLQIGAENVIREYVSIHLGTRGEGQKGEGATIIGDNNMLMNASHVGHDTRIGSNVIIASNVAIGGHCEIQDYAVIGGQSAVHQFTRVGESVMVAGLSGITLDAPPFTLVSGWRAKVLKLNEIGLQRRGFSKALRAEIARAYRLVFRANLRLPQALEQIRAEGLNSAEVRRFAEFLQSAKQFSRPRTAGRRARNDA